MADRDDIDNANGRSTFRMVRRLAAAPLRLPEPLPEPRDVNVSAALLVQATAQRYRIERCAACGGPKVFSKRHPVARCFRCGVVEVLGSVALNQGDRSWRRCVLCDRHNMGGLPIRQVYCRACAALSQTERAKRRRWKEAKTKSDPESGNKIAGATDATAPDSHFRPPGERETQNPAPIADEVEPV